MRQDFLVSGEFVWPLQIERMLGEAEVFNPFADYSGTEAGVQEG